MAGYSGTPLWKKLGIKPDTRWVSTNAPDGFEVPESPSHIHPALNSAFDGMIAFCLSADDVKKAVEVALSNMDTDGALWIAWPKKSSSLATELGQIEVMSIGLDSPLVDNKVCAIDEDWSGLRFVVRKHLRAEWRR